MKLNRTWQESEEEDPDSSDVARDVAHQLLLDIYLVDDSHLDLLLLVSETAVSVQR